MHNMVCLIGRLSTDVNEKDSKINIAVASDVKNEEGVYETIFVDILLYGQMLENTIKYLKKGDLVGVKGRLVNKDNELKVIADKLSFLTSKKVGEE